MNSIGAAIFLASLLTTQGNEANPGDLRDESLSAYFQKDGPTKTILVTSLGDEDIESFFRKAKCTACHVIPGIRGANGTIGPALAMGTTGQKRLNSPSYKGTAKSVREYVVESILDHDLHIPKGYRSVPMPMNYNTALAAKALYEMVDYLSALKEDSLPPTPPDPCNQQDSRSEKRQPSRMHPRPSPC